MSSLGADDAPPVVGIVSTDSTAATACAEILERSGARTLRLTSDSSGTADQVLRRIGALVFTGRGGHGVYTDLLLGAIGADMAVLCVSGGFHLLNEVMGGAAARPVAGHGQIEQDGELGPAYHRIYISPGSKLAAVVGSGGFVRVNSRHESGVMEAGKSPRLLASAYSLDDGVIEALESPEHRWVIGVQFQPEIRREVPPHFDRLFQSLVDRARELGVASDRSP